MNRALLVFSLFLVAVGVVFDLYLLSFFGLLMLIPALAGTPRPPVKTAPTPPKPQPRRIIPPPPPATEAQTPQPQPMAQAPTMSAPYAQPTSYSPPLFPTSMFPSLTAMTSAPSPPMEQAPAKQERRDELVEVGGILALLKLAFG